MQKTIKYLLIFIFLFIGSKSFSQRYKNLDELLIEVKENFTNSMIAEPGLTIEFKMLNS